MLGKVIIENGVKKIQALTADTGTGAPVGSYLYLEKKSNPQGYLFCDGSTFDETVYPALYQYLGTNVLPDWRELGAKGAEKNTTLIFDSTETDPSTGQAGTQNHDVFTQGEFKDDQLQSHQHVINLIHQAKFGAFQNPGPVYSDDFLNPYSTTETISGRIGSVTRGKSRAVFIYIKATSGLTENQQENVLNTINENLSYSTTEHKTGKKWIDGKPIYRKVIENPTTGVPILTGVDEVIDWKFKRTYSNSQAGLIINVYNDGNAIDNGITIKILNNEVYLQAQSSNFSAVPKWVVIEYTKTTD